MESWGKVLAACQGEAPILILVPLHVRNRLIEQVDGAPLGQRHAAAA